MKRLSLTGLLAPALLSVAAASQTIVVARPLPFTGVPRILPAPAGLPLSPARLPSPLPLPLPPLSLPSPLPVPRPAEFSMALAAPAALPAVRMDAEAELPAALRPLRAVVLRLEQAAAAPARAEKRETTAALDEAFDGKTLTLPEDDLERELGLR